MGSAAYPAGDGKGRPKLEQQLSAETFDAAIIGGGVFGALLALEGVARGQRVVLLERDDFGGGTSFNSLRTIHGGLRYLQTLDVVRSLASNAERLWWLRHFPDLVQPISCLMPLYGEGLRRPAAFRVALLLARLLGLGRDAHGNRPRSEVVSADEVRRLAPSVNGDGLLAGALWSDAFMPQSHRVIIECLRWAECHGAVLANYAEVLEAEPAEGRSGWRLTIRDAMTGRAFSVASEKVINAAGPDIDGVAGKLTNGAASGLLVPTLAFNLLLDRPPPSRCSVAVKPPGAGRRTYFVHPFNGKTLAGTGHLAVSGIDKLEQGVPEREIDIMLNDMNEALPDLRLSRQDIQHVFSGILPGVRAGSDELLVRARIVDHGAQHDAANAWSVLGVKFTEAPSVARKTWDTILGPRTELLPERPRARPATTASSLRGLTDKEVSAVVQSLLDEEWCCRDDDLLRRRTDLWMDKNDAARVGDVLQRERPERGSTN